MLSDCFEPEPPFALKDAVPLTADLVGDIGRGGITDLLDPKDRFDPDLPPSSSTLPRAFCWLIAALDVPSMGWWFSTPLDPGVEAGDGALSRSCPLTELLADVTGETLRREEGLREAPAIVACSQFPRRI